MSSPLKTVFVTLLLCATAGSANAEGWYLGGSFGASDVDVSGFDDTRSFRLFLGADANPHLALETGFVDLGNFDVIGSTASVDTWGIDLSVLGKLPVSDSMSLYGRLGLFVWDAEGSISGLSIASDTGTDITYGFGGEFLLSGNWNGRVAWDFYPDVSGGDIDVVSFGVSYTLY